MDADRAIEIAKLWRAGKMIGADATEVTDALLLKIEQLQKVEVSRLELEWLEGCSDGQMGDGDTARKLARIWLNGLSAASEINNIERRWNLGITDFPQP